LEIRAAVLQGLVVLEDCQRCRHPAAGLGPVPDHVANRLATGSREILREELRHASLATGVQGNRGLGQQLCNVSGHCRIVALTEVVRNLPGQPAEPQRLFGAGCLVEFLCGIGQVRRFQELAVRLDLLVKSPFEDQQFGSEDHLIVHTLEQGDQLFGCSPHITQADRPEFPLKIPALLLLIAMVQQLGSGHPDLNHLVDEPFVLTPRQQFGCILDLVSIELGRRPSLRTGNRDTFLSQPTSRSSWAGIARPADLSLDPITLQSLLPQSNTGLIISIIHIIALR
jgi:hypothetical protein